MWRLLVLLTGLAGPAQAVSCSEVQHQGTDFTICEVDPRQDDLRLFLAGKDGELYGSFSALERDQGTLAFAMNGGMYHDDRSPVGLFIEEGIEGRSIVTREGPGNFGLLPNGVFCIGDGWARVIESRRFAENPPQCRFATQSGPLLVLDGALHPRFIEGGTSRKYRNGVGTSADGTRVVFAISDDRVNFHDFATLFRDHLGLPDALFLDGVVSRLHAPQLGRSDWGAAMGPIIGVIE